MGITARHGHIGLLWDTSQHFLDLLAEEKEICSFSRSRKMSQ